MPYEHVEISENYLSRPFTVGSQAGQELVYDLWGTEDEEEIRAVLAEEAPPLYLGLLLQSISAEPVGGGVWKGYARYSGLEADSEYTFDTAGGTRRITQSIQTIAAYAPPYAIAPDFGGAIGVTDDRVEGTEVGEAKYEWTETHRFFDASITPEYRRALATLTYTWNDDVFRGWQAGEVLFQGANGTKRPDELWTITFRFAVSPNATGLVVGEISGIDKLGWDYLWVRHADFEDGDAFVLVKRPISAHVERVYYPGDFELLGIGVE